MTGLTEFFGRELELGPCLVSQNLNLLVVRGSAPLHVLAAVSAPDVYDSVLNPTGTQRELNREHARECHAYALGAASLSPEEDPRAFPEVILNVRDRQVVEVTDESDGDILDFDSLEAADEFAGRVVSLRVLIDRLSGPSTQQNPQISRVDGNHRLSGVDLQSVLAGESEDDPVFVPFALYVGLDTDKEVKLFKDINGEHKGMDVTHLTTIQYRLNRDSLLTDSKSVHIWYAHQLAEPTRAFANMIFFGGTKKGVKELYGEVPPLKLNSLAAAMKRMLRGSGEFLAIGGFTASEMLEIYDLYWKAVQRVFPEAWADKRGYILLQSIGLNAFSDLGNDLIVDGLREGEIGDEYFTTILSAVRDQVSLDRSDPQWDGVAGAGGAKRVYNVLLAATSGDAVARQRVISRLGLRDSDEFEALDD